MNGNNITPNDYKNAVDRICTHFENVPDAIKPVSIIQNGNIGSVGISDIDLIFVFPDSFDEGKEFDKEYQRAVQSIKYKDILFVHHPMLLNESTIKDLPYYTYNPAGDLNLLYGSKPDFQASHPSPIQSVLISLEFIQFRLFQLVNHLLAQNMSLRGILLRGHSLKHSLALAEHAGLTFGNEKFSAFNIIETIRASINGREEIKLSGEELSNLFKGIIREFYIVYKQFCKCVESYISFYLPEEGQYLYDENINLTGLFDKGNKLHRKVAGNTVSVEGFHWANMLLRDIYFKEQEPGAIIGDSEFIDECKKRAGFHKNQWSWNKKNFNNIHAGLSPMPCVIGQQARQYASDAWRIS